jgi:hypothetical protein
VSNPTSTSIICAAALSREVGAIEGRVWALIQAQGLDVHADGEHPLIQAVGQLMDAGAFLSDAGGATWVAITPQPLG